MTEMIMVAVLAIIWTGGVAGYSLAVVKKYKKNVEYYQQPEVQIAITRHVLKNRWYQKGGEVFK